MGQEHRAGWSDERVDELKGLWAEGLSGSQIAKRMGGGLSRTAVIAKAWRLGLPKHSKAVKEANHKAAVPRGNRVKGAAAPRPIKPRADNLAAVNVVRRVLAEDPGLDLPASAPLPGSNPKPWPERRLGECSWPIGDGRGPDLLSCCNPVHARGWCATHFVRGVQSIRAGQPRTPNELARSLRRFAAA